MNDKKPRSKAKEATENSILFSKRMAYWTSNGATGREVYERLAADTELPSHFGPIDIGAIVGLGPDAIKARRMKNMAPSFVKISGTHIIYPREALCRFLADAFRSAA